MNHFFFHSLSNRRFFPSLLSTSFFIPFANKQKSRKPIDREFLNLKNNKKIQNTSLVQSIRPSSFPLPFSSLISYSFSVKKYFDFFFFLILVFFSFFANFFLSFFFSCFFIVAIFCTASVFYIVEKRGKKYTKPIHPFSSYTGLVFFGGLSLVLRSCAKALRSTAKHCEALRIDCEALWTHAVASTWCTQDDTSRAKAAQATQQQYGSPASRVQLDVSRFSKARIFAL